MIEDDENSSRDCGWFGWLFVTACYVAAVSVSLSGIILHVISSSDATLTVLWIGALAVPLLHGAFSVAIKAIIKQYVHLSVEPGWIFLLTDLVQGGAFGASVVGYFCDSKHVSTPLFANTLLFLCNIVMVYKSVVLTWDTYHRRRYSLTGAPLISRKKRPMQPEPQLPSQLPPQLKPLALQPVQFKVYPLRSFPLQYHTCK